MQATANMSQSIAAGAGNLTGHISGATNSFQEQLKNVAAYEVSAIKDNRVVKVFGVLFQICWKIFSMLCGIITWIGRKAIKSSAD